MGHQAEGFIKKKLLLSLWRIAGEKRYGRLEVRVITHFSGIIEFTVIIALYHMFL